MKELWQFLTEVFKVTGVTGLICLVEAGLLYLAIRLYQRKDQKVDDLQVDLLAMSEKRREDTIEEREKYEDLAQDLNKSVQLLVEAFRKRNGNNGG